MQRSGIDTIKYHTWQTQDRKDINNPLPPWNGQKNILFESLHWFNGANLTLILDVDQDIDIWLAWKAPNLSMHNLI